MFIQISSEIFTSLLYCWFSPSLIESFTLKRFLNHDLVLNIEHTPRNQSLISRIFSVIKKWQELWAKNHSQVPVPDTTHNTNLYFIYVKSTVPRLFPLSKTIGHIDEGELSNIGMIIIIFSCHSMLGKDFGSFIFLSFYVHW